MLINWLITTHHIKDFSCSKFKFIFATITDMSVSYVIKQIFRSGIARYPSRRVSRLNDLLGALNNKWGGSLRFYKYTLNCLFIEYVCHRSRKPQNERYCLALSAFYTILPKNMANRVKIFVDRKVYNVL